jgi:hypothetical protein
MRRAPLVAIFLLVLVSTANATTCTEAIGKCRMAGASKANIDVKCQAAGAACMKSGTFIGPVTGTVWKHLRKE